MSQPVERRPETPPNAGGGLSAKVGPLPAWGWIGLAAVGGLIVLLYLRSRQSAAAGSTTDTTGTVAPSTADVANLQDQLATVTSQIRDLQGGPSQPTTPGSNQSFLFKLQGDANPDRLYIGIPGVGYYWVPNPTLLQEFLRVRPRTVDLGSIDQSTASTRFGAEKPWSSVGQGPTTQ